MYMILLRYTYNIYFEKLGIRECKTIFPFIFFFLVAYDLGFSFFSFHKANKETPETLTTLNLTPGISPLALPFLPKPANKTSSFSST